MINIIISTIKWIKRIDDKSLTLNNQILKKELKKRLPYQLSVGRFSDNNNSRFTILDKI